MERVFNADQHRKEMSCESLTCNTVYIVVPIVVYIIQYSNAVLIELVRTTNLLSPQNYYDRVSQNDNTVPYMDTITRGYVITVVL